MAAVKKDIMLKVGPFFGVPVSVLVAIDEDKGATSLNTLCDVSHAPNRVRQSLVCPTCQNDDKGTFKKGQERSDGTFAIVDTEAVAEAVAVDDSVKNTLTMTSHPAEQVMEHTLAAGKVYYLEPGKGGAAAYPLLVEMLRERPNLAFCTVWASRTVPAMYRLGVFGDALTLTQLAWPEKVKDAPKIEGTANPAEVAMALTLADALTSDFDPTTFKDTRAETLAAYIAAADGVEGTAIPTQAKAAPKATSMMDMLAAAVAAAAPAPAAKAPAKKAAPAKAPAKKAPARKAVA